MKWTKFIWEIKEGLILGALAGYVLGKYLFPNNVIDMNAVMQTQTVLDMMKSASQPAMEFAKDKLIIGCTIVGGLIGTVIDAMIPENKWKRGI